MDFHRIMLWVILIFFTILIILSLVAVTLWICRTFFKKDKYVNKNRRIYPEETVREAIEKFNVEKMDSHSFIGEMEHPIASNETIKYNLNDTKVLMKIQKVRISPFGKLKVKIKKIRRK